MAMREGFAIIYKNKPGCRGVDTYLRLSPRATSRSVTLREATLFASESEAERYARDFAESPEPNQYEAAVIPVTEEIVRHHTGQPRTTSLVINDASPNVDWQVQG